MPLNNETSFSPWIDNEVQLSLTIEQEYKTAQFNSWAKNFIEANKFRNGIQWTTEQDRKMRRMGQVPLVVNRMHPMVETAKSILTYNSPQFSATAREDSDIKTAKAFADLFSWMWDQSEGNELLKQCIDDYYVGGRGDIRIIQNPNGDMGKGELFLEALYPLDVLYDPNSRNRYARDSAHVIVSQILTDDVALRLWPEYEAIILKAREAAVDTYASDDLMNDAEVSFVGDATERMHVKRQYIERQTKILVPMVHSLEIHSGREFVKIQEDHDKYLEQECILVTDIQGQETLVTTPREIANLTSIAKQLGMVFHQVIPAPDIDPQTGQMVESEPMMVAGEEDANSVPNSTRYLDFLKISDGVRLRYVLTNNIQAPRVRQVISVGESLLFNRILPCEEYTIIPLMNIHNRTPLPESDVRLYKPIQQYINKVRSIIMAHASQSTSQKLIVPRGSINKAQVEKDWGRIGTAVIEVDYELGTPVIAGPVALSNELYKNEADAKYDLEYGFGIFALMQGSTEGAPNTYRGTMAIEEFGNRRIKSRRDDIEGFLNHIAKVAIPLMQETYTEEKMFRIIEPNHLSRTVQINQPIYDTLTGEVIEKLNDIAVGKYDIKIVSGSMLPSNRWAQAEYYRELYKEGIIDQVEVLKKSDVIDQEGVLRRFSYISKLEGALQQAEEKISNLEGDLQTATRAEVNARKRVAVTKFEGELNKQAGNALVATELHKVKLQEALNKADESRSSGKSSSKK